MKGTNQATQTLLTRSKTGIIFSIVMLLGMFLHLWTFKILFSIILLGCLYEFFKMLLEPAENKILHYARWTLAMAFSFLPYCFLTFRWFMWIDSNTAFGIASLVFFCCAFGLLLFEIFAVTERPFQNVGIIILAFFYLSIPFSMVSFLKYDQDGHFSPNIAWGVMLLTWANDSFAYLVGSRIGKTLFFPRISPKKTWEGTLGGIVGCVLVAVGFHFIGVYSQRPYFFEIFFDKSPPLQLVDWIVVAILVGVFGTLGDLIESMMKRSAGVKDSGNFMPGHGGFLDRFDAFIFAIPFVVAYFVLKFIIF